MSDLQTAIANATVDKLKEHYLTYFGVRPKQTRKAFLVETLTEGLSDHSRLKQFVSTISDLERTFLQESVFNYRGYIDRGRFELKYGQFPEKPQKNSWYYSMWELTDGAGVFFFTQGSGWDSPKKIPEAIIASLQKILDKPIPDSLKTSTLPEVLPEHHRLFERERLALSEFHSMLIMLQDKQLKVSEKTGAASGATLKKVAKSVHEYYETPSCEDAKGMEHIVSYGWMKLLGNSQYSKRSGTTLLAAKKTDNNPADTIKGIWQKWVSNRVHDEFRRIDRIKGQNGKGKRFFTDVVERRAAILSALSSCEENAWIAFDDFSRFMVITGANLEITSEPRYLYIYDPQYGEFYDGTWDYLEARYLRCFLVEYAATLGLVDVVMAPPNSDDAYVDDFGGMECLSRYDGLRFFRVTPLGRYVLGLTETYQSTESELSETTLSIHRQGRIVFDNQPAPWEERFLSLYADHDKGSTWKLSRQKIMETQQIGGSIEELKDFLLARDNQPFLPEDLEKLFKQASENLDGVKIKEEALIITCKNQEIAELIANDKVLSKWCQRLGKLQLVIPRNKEKKFKESLNAMGIGCS